MNDKVFKIESQVVGHKLKTFSGVEKYIVQYKQPKSKFPEKVWEHQACKNDLSESAIKLLESCKPDNIVCIHQSKDEKGFPTVVDIVELTSNTVSQKHTTPGTNLPTTTSNWVKDDSGIAVGAAWNNAEKAVELLGLKMNSVEDYLKVTSQIAWKILELKESKGKEMRNNKNPSISTTNATKVEKTTANKTSNTSTPKEDITTLLDIDEDIFSDLDG